MAPLFIGTRQLHSDLRETPLLPWRLLHPPPSFHTLMLPHHLHVQELPLLEVELGVRPDLSSHLEGDGKKPLDLKQKVRLAGMCGEGCSREHTACMLII